MASVHSHFDQSRAAMTRRFITACENPHVNVIGHPLTRKIGQRPPVDVDLPELFRACARTGTALEVNAHPNRLDLPSAHIRAAKDAGVKFAIDSDAHFTGGLDYLRYGVGHRAARLAHARRRDQHLAAAAAARVPAQGTLVRPAWHAIPRTCSPAGSDPAVNTRQTPGPARASAPGVRWEDACSAHNH